MRQANGGLGNARNSGIKVAKGKYILPLDADDLLSDNYIEATIKVLEENDIFSYVSSFGGCFRDGKGIDRLCEWSTPYGLCHDLLYFENGAGLATSLFRAAVFEDFHYDETLTAYEDWDFFMQLSVAGKSGIVIPEVLFYYRLRGTSMLRNIGQPNHIPLLRAMTSKQGRAGNLSQELKQALAHFYDEYQKSTGGNVVVADENEILKNNDEVGQSEVILDVRDFYLKWLKGPLYDVFPEHRARRIVNIIKSLLYRIFG